MYYLFTSKNDLHQELIKDANTLEARNMMLFSLNAWLLKAEEPRPEYKDQYIANYKNSLGVDFCPPGDLMTQMGSGINTLFSNEAAYNFIKSRYEAITSPRKILARSIFKKIVGKDTVYSCLTLDYGNEDKTNFVTSILLDIANESEGKKDISLILHDRDLFNSGYSFEDKLDLEENERQLLINNPLLKETLADRINIKKVYVFRHSAEVDIFYNFFDKRKSLPSCIEDMLTFIENPTAAQAFVEMKDNLNSYITSQDKQSFDKFGPKYFHDFKVKQIN